MAEPETGLITDCEMTMAAGPGSSDAENGVTMTARDRFCDPGAGAGPGGELDAHAGAGQGAGSAAAQQATGLEVYSDSAYASGEARAAYREAGHDTVIKPGPLRPAVPSLTAAGSASVRHLTHARAATLGRDQAR